MAHKISKAEAIQKYENEKEIQELAKQGKYKSTRAERKRKMRELKHLRFMDMLKIRGGLFKPKKKEKGNGKEEPET